MRFLPGTISIAATVAALLATSSASAQVTAARPWSAEGAIADSDRQDESERRYDEHRVRLEPGRRYRLTANSEAFDPTLKLYAPGSTEPAAENDDSGESLNSRIIYVPENAGAYTLRVGSFAAEGRGAYTLRAELLPPLPPAMPIQLAPRTMTWTSVDGSLTADDPEVNGAHGDDYSLFLAEGDEVIIRADGAFDTVVSLFRAADRDGDPAASDDDGGGGLNSMLRYRADAAGEYVIRVTALGDGTGPYRLRIGQ
jgi:hypothetical protein